MAIPALLWDTFELAVTEIAPYVEEQEIKELRSKWVTMQNQDDYIAIDNYIREIKNNHKSD